MAAGFRTPEEVVELSRYGNKGGPDLVTLPPELLEGLMKMDGNIDLGRDSTEQVPLTDSSKALPIYFASDGLTEDSLALFERDSRQEAISLDKVPEGLAKFSADAVKLETAVRNIIEQFVHARLSDVDPTSADVFQESRDRLAGDEGGVLRRKSVSVN